MARGKKRAPARRGKATRRTKAPQRVKRPVKVKKTAKPSAIKAKPKKAASRAKTQRTVAKRLTPSRAKPPQQRIESPIEVIKVETVEEPAPGTVIVTEYEEVRVPAGGSITGQTRKQGGLDLPDPEED
jgi:hypothetical protein